MIFGNFSLGGLFHREPDISSYDRWYDGRWELQDVSRLGVEDVESLKKGVNRRLKDKKAEFKKMEIANEIKIDEAAIHKEIQQIMEMDKEALDAMQKDIQRRLKVKREEFNELVGGYWG